MEYSREFKVFWRLYPKRWSKSQHEWIKRRKFPAWQSWQKLSSDTQTHILGLVKKIKQSEGSAVRDAVTWLNQRGWDDMDMPADWVPQLPDELTVGLCEAPEKDLNMGKRRTALIKQFKAVR